MGDVWGCVLGCVGAVLGDPGVFVSCLSLSLTSSMVMSRTMDDRENEKKVWREENIPISRIMLLLHRVTSTSMRRCKNPLPTPIPLLLQGHPRIQLHLHQLIHIPPDKNIPIQKNHPLILLQRKRNQLRPRFREPRVLRVLAIAGWYHVGDPLCLDAAGLEDFQAFGWEGGGI